MLTEAEAAVPAELLEKTSLVGPESYLKERIEGYHEAGVTVLYVQPVGPDPASLIGRLKTLVG